MPITEIIATRIENVRYIRTEPEPDTVTIIHEREQHPGEAPEAPTLWPEGEQAERPGRVTPYLADADQRANLESLSTRILILEATLANLREALDGHN